MLKRQTQMKLSKHSELYDILVTSENELRKINELVDFSFVYDELKDKYSATMGRGAIDPIMMFKYLFLKALYPTSDVGLVKRALTDMSYKYFLGLNPEDPVIESSTLTKFRRQRLKDVNLLDLLIQKSVVLAKEKGLLKGKTIIVDSTHTNARYNHKSPRQILQELSKTLRKNVYKKDKTMKEKMPSKPSSRKKGMLEAEMKYTQKLCDIIRKEDTLMVYGHIKEGVDYLEEIVDDHMHELTLSKDEDAKIGHKNADTHFFGYKTHIAMSDERIVTAATVTSGEKHDGKQLKELVKKSKKAGVDVKEIIGDAAYSESDNIEYSKDNKIKLVSKLSRTVSDGNKRRQSGFYYNKDAGLYVCPEGHMAVRKTLNGQKNYQKDGSTRVETHFFDIEKCKVCPKKGTCYKDGAKSRSYSVSIKSKTHKNQLEFQNSEEFKQSSKKRYKIEAKNSELKNVHAYGQADSHGISGMNLQAATTIFTINIKRIMKLMG